MKLTHTPGPTAHTIAIEGSVDTVTAPELEAAIAALPATLERLILDFATSPPPACACSSPRTSASRPPARSSCATSTPMSARSSR